MKDKIEIDGQEYVLASSVKGVRESVANNKYVIVRTYSAGVFAGEDVVEYGSGSGDGSGSGY